MELMKRLTKNITSVTINVSNCGKTYEINKVIDTHVKIKQEDIKLLQELINEMGKVLTQQIEGDI